jgi:hypothetical protein
MRRLCLSFALPFLLINFITLSHAVAADDTKFVITTEDFPPPPDSEELTIVCAGPWDRCGSVQLEDGEADGRLFYTATGDGLFSHYGLWACNVSSFDPSSPQLEEPEVVTPCDVIDGGPFSGDLTDPGKLDKAVTSIDGLGNKLIIPEIRFTIPSCATEIELAAFGPDINELAMNVLGCSTSDGVRSEGNPQSVGIGGFLGEDSRIDSDEYLFEGEAGDEITVKLNRDRSSGSLRGDARLRLENRVGGVHIEETGLLPLKISLILPESGSYAIDVSQVEGRSQEAFRGNFILEVTSSTDNIRPLQAQSSVER